MKILYVAPFTSTRDHSDSGVIGYGVTSGGALVRELRRLGHDVRTVPRAAAPAHSKADHAARTYAELARCDLAATDCVLVYNVFHQFAAEIRRLLYEDGATTTMLVGYSHGSHWDPSDLIRHAYPQLRFADLGNVLALDRVLLVSEYMRDTMARTIRAELGPGPAHQFARRARVVGLTIDTDRLETSRTPKDGPPGILFNHSATTAKRPEVFFRTIAAVLDEVADARLTVTRRFTPADPGYDALGQLRARHGERVRLGDTLPVDDYFAELWRSHVQVSTASHESFGVSTVEAIYAGCCGVLPAIGCYPEIAGPAGIYAEGELAERVTHYLRDQPARQRTADAQRLAIARYLPEAVARRISNVLEEA